jgi:asparagine synthetase B (glutamine-hydrolysing)
LSLLYADAACNEELVQRSVAEALGIPQITSRPEDTRDGRGFVGRAVDAVLTTRSAAELDYLQHAYDQLAEDGKRDGCRVLMSGEGGDEWLQVHPAYCFGRLVRRLKFGELVYLLRSHRRYTALDSTGEYLWRVLWEHAAMGSARQVTRQALERLERLGPPVRSPATTLLDRGYARLIPPWALPDRALREQLVDRWRMLSADQHEHDAYTRSRRRFLDHHGLSVLREASFDQARRLGLLVFEPYLDPDLVQFLYQASPRALAFGRRARGLAHASLAKRLARPVPPLRPVYFDSFETTVSRMEASRVLERLGGVPTLAGLGLVDSDAVTSAAPSGLTTPTASSTPVLDVLLLEAWLRAWS